MVIFRCWVIKYFCCLLFPIFPLALSGQDWEKSVYIIETDSGQGSGFLVEDREYCFLMTNAHVLAGAKEIKAIDVQGEQLPLTPFIQVADDGRDLVRIPVRARNGLSVASNAHFGEPIIVLGNSGGARMVTHSRGKILAVGPDRIEVSAAFIPGNSGGPVLNAKNQVVGVATYVFRDAVPDWVAQNTRYAQTRRVALRINGIKWRHMNWFDFQQEGELVTKHQKFFEDSVQRLNRAFATRDMESVLREKQGIRGFLGSFQRDFNNLRVAYLKKDLEEVSEGWQDLWGFLDKNFPGSPRSGAGGQSFTRAPRGGQWPKVDIDRAEAYLKEKAVRDRERAGAIEANIRKGLETGKVNNLPFKKALAMVDYKTQKKYEKIAKQVARELDASYSEALQVYRESSREGIEILKQRLILEECMGYVDRALVTRSQLHTLKVPGF